MAGREISRRNVLKAAIGFGAGVGLAGMPWPRAFAAPRALVPRQLGDYPWQARHGLDAAAHQAEFDSLSAQGYRLLRVSGCSVDNVAYYASIWEQSPGPAFVARHGIDGGAYQSEFDTWVGQGYRLVDVSGFELDGADHYAAIWYQGVDFPFGANHGLSNADYQAAVDRYIADGYRPLHVSGYTVNGEDRYATIWEGSPGPAFVARHGLDAAAYQAEFDAQAAGGFRLVDVSGYNIGGTDYYAAIFEADPGGAWIARHGLDAGAYQADFDDLADQGYRLRVVSGFGSNGTVRYATVWNEGPGGLRTATDRIAQAAIANAGVPAVSVAIARNGQLVYAKAFGMADAAANEAVTVDHRFRIASISKPITSAAIMTLVENGQLALADTVFGTGGILGTQYGTQPYPNGLTTITVQHLLEHTAGGWPNRNDDPMFAEPARFGAAFITWVIDNTGPGKRFPLANTPGTNYDYSNFGYCLLGRVIEEVTGQSYDAYVQGAVLAPCGIAGMEIAGDTLADRRAGRGGLRRDQHPAGRRSAVHDPGHEDGRPRRLDRDGGRPAAIRHPGRPIRHRSGHPRRRHARHDDDAVGGAAGRRYHARVRVGLGRSTSSATGGTPAGWPAPSRSWCAATTASAGRRSPTATASTSTRWVGTWSTSLRPTAGRRGRPCSDRPGRLILRLEARDHTRASSGSSSWRAASSSSSVGSSRWWPSTSIFGRIRSSQRGSHQLRSPSSSIVAGTSTMRTIVASMMTAMPRPSPNSFSCRSSASTKAPNTKNMMSAAAVITRAVIAKPSATAVPLSGRHGAPSGRTPP